MIFPRSISKKTPLGQKYKSLKQKILFSFLKKSKITSICLEGLGTNLTASFCTCQPVIFSSAKKFSNLQMYSYQAPANANLSCWLHQYKKTAANVIFSSVKNFSNLQMYSYQAPANLQL